jgi:predicted lipid-binding transport protein (Tim44 family)
MCRRVDGRPIAAHVESEKEAPTGNVHLMSDQIDLTTVVFALVAMFVVWKVRSILGARDQEGDQTISRSPKGAGTKAGSDAATLRDPKDSGRWSPFASYGTETWTRLDEISKLDPSFDPREFVEGAKAAYDFILKAYSAGDLQTLRPLLADEVYESFSAAISQRAELGRDLETTLVSIDRAEMKDIRLDGKTAQIMMRYESKLISATRDKAGVVVEGDAGKVIDVVDIWTFRRDLQSNDPNWRLISTEEPH